MYFFGGWAKNPMLGCTRLCAVNLTIPCREEAEQRASRLGQIHDFNPVRILAHRLFVELGELPAVRVDLETRQCMRELANRKQIASGRGDVEAARLLFGEHAPDRQERALGRVDSEAGKGARRALRPIEESAVGGDVQIGGQGVTLEVGRQGTDSLFRRAAPRA